MSYKEELEAQRQVKSTLASLEMEGLHLDPNELAVQLSYEVALGKMTSVEAMAKLKASQTDWL